MYDGASRTSSDVVQGVPRFQMSPQLARRCYAKVSARKCASVSPAKCSAHSSRACQGSVATSRQGAVVFQRMLSSKPMRLQLPHAQCMRPAIARCASDYAPQHMAVSHANAAPLGSAHAFLLLAEGARHACMTGSLSVRRNHDIVSVYDGSNSMLKYMRLSMQPILDLNNLLIAVPRAVDSFDQACNTSVVYQILQRHARCTQPP